MKFACHKRTSQQKVWTGWLARRSIHLMFWWWINRRGTLLDGDVIAGEPTERDREAEFKVQGVTQQELLRRLSRK